MQIVVVGMNHRSAPLAVRERVAFVSSELPAFYAALRERTPEGFLLTTCNRTEVYALAGHAESGAASMMTMLSELRGFPIDELEPYVYRLGFEDAARHLFSVASGLDSMVPGEEQILSQVRRALHEARDAGALGPVMHRLGASALSVGKRVRAETTISRHALSVVSVALRAATERVGPLAGRRVLVIGGGDTARLALRHLERAHANVTLCNRTDATARRLADAHQASVVPWPALSEALADADVVVACTNAADIVVNDHMVRRAMAKRPQRPMLVIDLGVPRNVAATVGGIADVALVDLDELQVLSSQNREFRTAEIVRAEGIIATAVERFMTWWNARQVAPTITSLLASAAATRDREIDRALARMPGLSERDRDVVRTLGARIVAQLFHQPMRTLKTSEEGANLAWAVQQLFGLPANPALTGPGPNAAVAREQPAEAPGTDCPHVARTPANAE